MLRHQSEMELSGPWAGVGISQGGGALWSPSQPETGRGKGGSRGLAKTRNQGQRGVWEPGALEAQGAEAVGGENALSARAPPTPFSGEDMQGAESQ